MRYFFIFWILCSTLAFGAQPHLQERLEKAHKGDYIVFESNKMITLLAIRSITPETLLLEEISAPSQNLKTLPTSWGDWVKAKAPGHSSWSMTEIDLKKGQILECFSFSRSGWIQLSQNESLYATLLKLPLEQVPPDQRRRIGPPPSASEPDFRKLWVPPLISEGKKITNPIFEVFKADWPEDGTDLSGKGVILYFDGEHRFPLPFWIQVDSSHLSVSMRAIDSGRNLPLIHRTIPRRNPEFTGPAQKTENGLRLSLKSPKYYRQFELFAIDITQKEKQIHSLSHRLLFEQEELIGLEIEQTELEQVLEPDHRYQWLLVPTGHSECYAESIKPFIWDAQTD